MLNASPSARRRSAWLPASKKWVPKPMALAGAGSAAATVAGSRSKATLRLGRLVENDSP